MPCPLWEIEFLPATDMPRLLRFDSAPNLFSSISLSYNWVSLNDLNLTF